MSFPEEIYDRIVKNSEIWIVIQRLLNNKVICVKESDINGGADYVPTYILELE